MSALSVPMGKNAIPSCIASNTRTARSVALAQMASPSMKAKSAQDQVNTGSRLDGQIISAGDQ